jgi:hypothetical protein
MDLNPEISRGPNFGEQAPRLKTLIANRDLEIDAIKELLRKNS